MATISYKTIIMLLLFYLGILFILTYINVIHTKAESVTRDKIDSIAECNQKLDNISRYLQMYEVEKID